MIAFGPGSKKQAEVIYMYQDSNVYTEATDEAVAALPGLDDLTPEQLKQIFPLPGQEPILYKVTEHDLRSTHSSNHRLNSYDPPTENGPGEWTLIHENPRMCSHGVHVTADPVAWASGIHYADADRRPRIFEVEAKNIVTAYAGGGVHHDPSNKVVASTIRLVRELDLSDFGQDDPNGEWAKIVKLNEDLEADRKERAAEIYAERQARYAEELKQAQEEARQKRIEKDKERAGDMSDAARNGQIYVPNDANAREVLIGLMPHLACPHCDSRLEGFRREQSVTEYSSRTDTYTLDVDGDFDEETGEDSDCYDSDYGDEELFYRCCDHEVRDTDYEDLFKFEKTNWGGSRDFQDLVRDALQD